MASQARFLLITSNLGSLFEEPAIENGWFSEIEKEVSRVDPDFIALHFQEIGGKEFETTMPKASDFIRRFGTLQCMADFNRMRAYVDTNYKDVENFTALGNFYFVHKRAGIVQQWNFETKEFEEVIGKRVYYDARDSHDSITNNKCHYKERFPEHFFPIVRWTRKGFLHTRWLINSKVMNFVNIHCFHDEDNLVALEKSPSDYSTYRHTAIKHSIDRINSNMILGADERLFVFGDFNFRLDLAAVVKHISNDHQPQFVRGEDGNLQKIIYRNPLQTDDDFSIERRKFFANSYKTLFTERYRELLQFDKESQTISLRELPITFAPSYPFSEELTEGNKYMEKRCPGWCDRILMNDSAMMLVNESLVASKYDILSRGVCCGDHKPVSLSFGMTGLPEANKDTRLS